MRGFLFDPENEGGSTAVKEKVEAAGSAADSVADSTADESFELVNDGQVEKVTRDRVLADAQKGRYVLPKIRSELDQLKKEFEDSKVKYEGASDFVDDFKAAISDEGAEGESAIRRIGQAIGWSDEQINFVLQGEEGETEADYDDSVTPGRHDSDDEAQQMPQQTTLEGLKASADPKLRRLLEKLEQDDLNEIRTNLTTSVDRSLEGDADLAKLKEHNSRAFEVLQGLGHKALQRRVGAEGQHPGPQLFADIVDEVKQVAKTLGIRGEGPQMTADQVAKMGLGAVAAELGEELYREQPPKRVPVTDPDYNKNLLRRVAHRVKSGGGLGPGANVPWADDEMM